MRGLKEDAVEALRNQSGVRELGVRTPSLEEIFVAYLELSQHADLAPFSPGGRRAGDEGAATEVMLP